MPGPRLHGVRSARGPRCLFSHAARQDILDRAGWIVPAATEQDGVVVNGMSLSRRDSPYANSGIVVGVELADLA
ncbi:MAG: hypothetical protein F9K40_16470, partial [Kofleriaceae bacterium]